MSNPCQKYVNNRKLTDFQIQSILQNPSALKENYVPNEILFRENEMRFLATTYFGRALQENYFPENIFIYGRPATAKTLCVKTYMHEFEEEVKKRNVKKKAFYLNCHENETPRKFARSLLLTIMAEDETAHWMKHNDSSALDICKKFLEYVEKEYETVLLIIDEVDKLKDKDFLDRFIYIFSRAQGYEIGLLKECDLGLCLISNDPGIISELSSGTKSSLGINKYAFKPYDAGQMLEIIDSRCKEALVDGSYTQSDLLSIINYSKEQQDLRVALDILRQAVKIAETKHSSLDNDIVKEAYHSFITDEYLQIAASYKFHEKAIVLVIGNRHVNSKGAFGGVSVRDIYTSYLEYVKAHPPIEPISERTIRRYVKDMSEKENVLEEAKTVGKETFYRLTNIGFKLLPKIKEAIEDEAYDESIARERAKNKAIIELKELNIDEQKRQN